MNPLPRSLRDGWPACLVMLLAVASFAILLCAPPAHAQGRAAATDLPARTASPYFVVSGAEAGIAALPLYGTEVEVKVAGVIAEVTVRQHYRHEGTRPIGADYVFPGSTRAAVGGMQIHVGARTVTANIREKQQARIEFATAKREGKTAALLEQHRPNVFQMHVANILPGDDVRVELRYTELLVPEEGRYAFVYPTVVGPRYTGGGPSAADTTITAERADGAEDTTPWTAQPTLRPGTPPTARFALQLDVDAPLPIQDIRSRTHRLDIRQQEGDARHARVRLADDGRAPNDRDIVIDYRLDGDVLASGLMLAPGARPEDPNYFLAMVQPPRAVPASRIVPREYLFVVDISGSMHGFPLDTAKAMLQRLIGGLRPSDSFNVLLFAGSSRMLAPQSVPATQANIDRALAVLGQKQGGGGTELIPALRRVYAEPKAADIARSIVVVTDGYVTVEQEAFALVRRHLGQANLFAFGIGSSVNRTLIEGLARAGGGEPFVITDPIQAPEQAARFRRLVESPVLTGVQLRFEGLEAYDVEPANQPDVLGERPVVVFGKWRSPALDPTGARGALVVTGHAADGPWQQRVEATATDHRTVGALRALWARHRITALADQEALEGGDAYRTQITQLGLEHSLLTSYTSFIAVDEVVRNPNAANTPTVRQPQPLPQGVGALAVGGAETGSVVMGAVVPSTPEPETWGAMLVALSMLAMVRRRLRRNRAQRYTS